MLTKKASRTALFVTIIIVLLVFPSPTFAADTNDISKQIFDVLDMVVQLLSWIRVVPASIAGKLMTNDFIYGRAFFLDRYLWRMRTFMRTMALFTLGFLLVVEILKIFFKKEGSKALMGTLGKVAIAGILIPMSWWLIAVVIDMSIVTTATVASLPLHVMEGQWNKMSSQMKVPKRIDVDSAYKINKDILANSDNYVPLTLQEIMPQADSVAGPFIFMGAALLRLQESNFVPVALSDWKKLTLAQLIKVVVLLSFSVPLFVLMVVNMMRVFYIWVWIIFSPFLVLDHVFKGPLQANSSFGKYFKLSNMFSLIFQPVVIVGLLSLGMVLLIGVSDVLLGGTTYDKGGLEKLNVVCTDDKTCIIGPKALAEVTVKGELFQHLGGQVGGIMGEIILVGFVVFLLRSLVKAGFSVASLTAKMAEDMYKFSGNMLGNVNFLPGISANTISIGAERAGDLAKNKLAGNSYKQASRILQPIERMFGASGIGFTPQHLHDLHETVERNKRDPKHMSEQYWQAIEGILSKTTVKGDDPELKQSLQHWLQSGGFDEVHRINPAIFGTQLADYKADVTKIRNNPSVHKFFDRMLKNPGGTMDTIALETEGLPSINGETYGTRNN